MKKLTKIEIKNKIIKYLKNKGIEVALNEDQNLVWNYEPYYSKYTVKIYVEDKNYNSGDFKVTYYSSSHVKGIKRRKTAVTDGFCLKIYRNLMWIKEQLDVYANEVKAKTDIKIKYCTELEIHYKKLYKHVDVRSEKNFDNTIDININCYDNSNNCYYSITYKENRYYLNHKTENLEIDIPLI
jgi:hypothetical protein